MRVIPDHRDRARVRVKPDIGETLLIGFVTHAIVTGVTVAFDLLVSGFEERGLRYSVVDLSGGRSIHRSSVFNMQRAFDSARIVLQTWLRLWSVQRVYLTIASSRLGFMRDALIIWPATLLNRTLILHLHGNGYAYFYTRQPGWLQAIIRRTLSQADRIIVLGQLLRAQFSFLADSDRKLRVVPCGLPRGLTIPAQRTKLLTRNSSLKMLFLSNMMESKGYKDLLAACRLLKERGIPCHCDFCGDFVSTAIDEDNDQTPQEAMREFAELVKRWHLVEYTTYHGRVTGSLKQRLLEEAGIFVLPTYHPWEGQPISIIEAMAFGTPVIATRIGGIPEEVIDSYNGFLVDARRPDQIADAIERLWLSPEIYAQMSRNAIEHFEANFTQEAHLNRLIGAILNSPSSSVGRTNETNA